jgi:hypothetical protein
MKEKIGELIKLEWDGRPDAYYVKGHIDKGEAVTVVEDYHGALSMGKSPVVNYVWAKWCTATEDDGVPEGCEFTLRVQQEESRGWFRVTEVRKEGAK